MLKFNDDEYINNDDSMFSPVSLHLDEDIIDGMSRLCYSNTVTLYSSIKNTIVLDEYDLDLLVNEIIELPIKLKYILAAVKIIHDFSDTDISFCREIYFIDRYNQVIIYVKNISKSNSDPTLTVDLS